MYIVELTDGDEIAHNTIVNQGVGGEIILPVSDVVDVINVVEFDVDTSVYDFKWKHPHGGRRRQRNSERRHNINHGNYNKFYHPLSYYESTYSNMYEKIYNCTNIQKCLYFTSAMTHCDFSLMSFLFLTFCLLCMLSCKTKHVSKSYSSSALPPKIIKCKFSDNKFDKNTSEKFVDGENV